MMASFVALVEVCFLFLFQCSLFFLFLHLLFPSQLLGFWFLKLTMPSKSSLLLLTIHLWTWSDPHFLPCPMSNAVLWCLYCYVQICKCDSVASLDSQSRCWLAGIVKLSYLCNMKYATRSCMVVHDFIHLVVFLCVDIAQGLCHPEEKGWWFNKNFASTMFEFATSLHN